jgi:DNA (cytosine-5)-methyltransferase 1
VKKPRLLDLFCGAGGAAMGYSRAGFEVVGVDIKPQPHFPFEFHQADALTYPLEGFDAYHASPPCQEYSVTLNTTQYFRKQNHPKLLSEVREILQATGKPYVIENVFNAKYKKGKQDDGLQAHFLCGTMFEKPYYRHRLFETSFLWLSPGHHRHNLIPGYGTGIKTKTATLMHCRRDIVEAAAKAFDIDWMDAIELTQAIPPAYTEYIGKYLLEYLNRK